MWLAYILCVIDGISLYKKTNMCCIFLGQTQVLLSMWWIIIKIYSGWKTGHCQTRQKWDEVDFKKMDVQCLACHFNVSAKQNLTQGRYLFVYETDA